MYRSNFGSKFRPNLKSALNFLKYIPVWGKVRVVNRVRVYSIRWGFTISRFGMGVWLGLGWSTGLEFKVPGHRVLPFWEIWDGVWLGLGWSTGLGFKVPGHRILQFREIWDGVWLRLGWSTGLGFKVPGHSCAHSSQIRQTPTLLSWKNLLWP